MNRIILNLICFVLRTMGNHGGFADWTFATADASTAETWSKDWWMEAKTTPSQALELHVGRWAD